MADEVDEIPQALRHALKEDFHTYGINHHPFEEKKKFEGDAESTHLYAAIFLAFVEARSGAIQ